MPLDIQPLSPARRAMMLVVLLALFGASLGFAQLLIGSRQSAAAMRYTVMISAPAGFVESVAEYEKLEGAVLSGLGRVQGNPRRFAAFSYDLDSPVDAQSMREEAVDLYQHVLGEQVVGEGGLGLSTRSLGHWPAIQVEGSFGQGEASMFLIERLTMVPGRVVAICFSGPGRITDGDKAFFDYFCSNGVAIKPVAKVNP